VTIMPHNTMLKRIRAEYLEMPGLRLTPEQAQRLCGVERVLCKMVLDALVDAKFLCVKSGGAYARLTDGDVPRSSPAKADFSTDTRVKASCPLPEHVHVMHCSGSPR
jgi:hypothetical protein